MMANTKKEKNKLKSFFMKYALNPNNLRTLITVYRIAATVRRLPGSHLVRKNITSTSSNNSSETLETDQRQTYNRFQLKITVLPKQQQIFSKGYSRFFFSRSDFQHLAAGVGLLGKQRKWIGYHLPEEKQGSDFQDKTELLPSLHVASDINDAASLLGKFLQISHNNNASFEDESVVTAQNHTLEEQSVVTAQDHTFEEQSVFLSQDHTLEEQSVVLAQDHTLEEQSVVLAQDHTLEEQSVLQAHNYNSGEQSLLRVQYHLEVQPLIDAYNHNANELPVLQTQHGQSLALPPNDIYQSHASRYFSFRSSPIRDTALVGHLVSSGFFYTGFRDRVQCFHCHEQLENLNSLSVHPCVLHLTTFRNCGFARQEIDSAVPSVLCTALTTYQSFYQIRAQRQFFRRTVEQPVNEGQAHGDGHIPTEEELGALGLFPACLPHRNLNFHQRRRSFQGMSALFPHPDHLARAGFYYAGYADAIRCFYCGGGLRYISSNADIYRLHFYYYPDCIYIQCVLRMVNQLDVVQERHVVAESSDINRYREEDVEQIAHILQCWSCRSQRASILFIPCGHLFLCLDCGIRALICWLCYRRVERFIHVLNSNANEEQITFGT